MDALATAVRRLLEQVEAGEVAGLAFTANLKTGTVETCLVGDFGGRIVQMLDLRSGRTQVLRGAH